MKLRFLVEYVSEGQDDKPWCHRRRCLGNWARKMVWMSC